MKRAITFFGADAKVGTTMIAQSVAEGLAIQRQKVLLVFASSETFDDYISSSTTKSIDQLRGHESLRREQVDEVVSRHGLFDYIKGVQMPLEIKYFSENLIMDLVKLERESYDYIIIDGGHNPQYPLSIGSLLATSNHDEYKYSVPHKRFFVLTQNYRCIQRFQLLKELVLSGEYTKLEEMDEIILNKYIIKGGTYTESQVKELFQIPVMTIPIIQGIEASFEATKQTPLASQKGFSAPIGRIVEKIMEEDC